MSRLLRDAAIRRTLTAELCARYGEAAKDAPSPLDYLNALKGRRRRAKKRPTFRKPKSTTTVERLVRRLRTGRLLEADFPETVRAMREAGVWAE